jgi:hypothetical protein
MSDLPSALSPADHYRSSVQCALWQEVHEEYSPRKQAGYEEFYHQFFSRTGSMLSSPCPELVLLGAGSGWKEAALAEALGMRSVKRLLAVDADVSLLDLTEREFRSHGFRGVFEGKQADFMNMPWAGQEEGFGVVALGILPNVDPELFLSMLQKRIPSGAPVWLSTHMTTPGEEAVLEQYQNQTTERWLEQFFIDQGVRKAQFEWHWTVRVLSFGWRIEGHVTFSEGVCLSIDGIEWHYPAGSSLQAFYSNRMDQDGWETFLKGRGFQVLFSDQNFGDGLWFCRSKD